MKMTLLLIALLSLSACQPVETYKPPLTNCLAIRYVITGPPCVPPSSTGRED